MNSIKQLFRLSFVNCANKQRRALIRSKGFAPVQSNLQYHFNQYKFEYKAPAAPLQSIEITTSAIQYIQKKSQESHGLLDLAPKGRGIQWRMDNGDFSNVSQENFAHILQFSQTDLELGNFNLDEMETVCSQSVDNLSFVRDEKKPNAQNCLDESMESAESLTETDIFFELPNSEVIENLKEKYSMVNKSAPI